MQNWISARINWLDAAINRLDATIVLGAQEEPSLRAFPNPARHTINLEFPLQQDSNLRLEIFDLLGRVVLSRPLGLQKKGSVIIPLDISSISPGRYVITILMDNELLFRFPVVKSLD